LYWYVCFIHIWRRY